MTVVGDLVQRNGDGQAHVVYSVARRLRDRLTPCVVYTVHKETRSVGFLVWPQYQGRRVSLFGHQNQQLQFDDLSLKITVIVFWFGPQNQAGYNLSVVPQNRRDEDGAGHTSRSSGLFHIEASQARVS
jgi:hypothetical protein